MTEVFTAYKYANAQLNASHCYLLPALKNILRSVGSTGRLFELGCGNGSIASQITEIGFDVTGVDPSDEGIRQARMQYPHLKLLQGSAYDDLAETFGRFPMVVSLEVVEHVYFPRKYAQTVSSLLDPGGFAIISTPYHGYWKNLALAITGKMDAHFTALWDGGHIKFWSVNTLTELLNEAGLEVVRVEKVGRIPPLAKSMIVLAKKTIS